MLLKHLKCDRFLILASTVTSFLLLTVPKAQANAIAPDSTLPISSSVLCNGNLCTINGGTTVGSNLFHSFTDFSIPTGGEAYFNNTATINNIISRVTGNFSSNIDGLIRANNTANVFLINPNGIVFGANAKLNIGGSFVATTANGMKFADGSFFSATNAQTPPLLTMNVPIGLQFGENPQPIQVQGTGHSLNVLLPLGAPFIKTTSTGLQVPSGKTLALLGGDVVLDGGNLTTPSGQIHLGSVGGGFVSLIPNISGWNFSYEGVQTFKDISLSQKALVDASGTNR